MLAKTADGFYAADTVALSIPRQVGKTFDIGAVVFALCIATPGLTVIWTAHRFKVSRETFNELRALAKSPKLVPHLDYDEITTAAGNECIPFRNGARIVFAARERGAIRGFTKVGILILDEAQILTDAALSDLAPTMNQAENPIIIMMGTPPKPTDPGEVFTNIREEALEGTSEGVLYVEFSAAAGSDPDDREAWKVANPSFPKRTSERAILRLRKILSIDSFLREALGIWDTAATRSIFSKEAWDLCGDVGSTIDGPPILAVEVADDRSWSAIAAAGACTAGVHGEVTGTEAVKDYRPGVDWTVPRVVDLAKSHGAKVVIRPGSEAGSLIADIEDAGVEVIRATLQEYAQACGMVTDEVKAGTFRHIRQGELDTAVKGTVKRKAGDASVWDQRKSSLDISPWSAVTLAVWGHKVHGAIDVSGQIW